MKKSNSLSVVVTEVTPDGWVYGNCSNFRFQGRVFDEPSDYGIDSGRISKLFITSAPNWKVYEMSTIFDRGWDVKAASGVALQVQNAVIAFLEKMPTFKGSQLSS